MTSRLEGRRCVITGVTSGIGHATLLRLLSDGAAIIGVARDAAKLEALAAGIGPRFTPILADLAVPEDRLRASRQLRELGRSVDVFVSNAGEAMYESPLTVSLDALRRLFEVNVLAPLELCQTLVPMMERSGHIVQVSSVTARFVPAAKFAPYATTKLAAERLLEALRMELHPKGIRVSVLVPGLVETPIYDTLRNFGETRQRLREQVPTWLAPEHVAEAIAWILSRPSQVVVSEMTLMPERQVR